MTARPARILLSSLIFLLTLFASQSAFAALGASVTLAAGQPTSINPGEITQLQITLSNNNTLAPISAAAFANALPGVLPNGLRIAGAATYECTDPTVPTTALGVGSLKAIVGTQAPALSGGVIPVRANSVRMGSVLLSCR